MTVTPFKIVAWIALAIAIVGAFTDVPYAGLLLVLLGAVAAFGIAAEDHVRVLVSALVLHLLSGELMHIPEAGEYLAAIFSAFATFAAGVALMLVSRNVWRRYRP